MGLIYMSEDNKIEIPDVFGDALISVMNAAHAKGELVTGFVCLLETYNGKRKKMITVTSPDMPEYQAYGMINFASINFEYADSPDDDDFESDDDYDPNWYKNQ
jgi:hypothetical protein